MPLRSFVYFINSLQANLANVRELKMGVETIQDANNIANFTVALTRAFEILEQVILTYFFQTRIVK